MKKVMEFKEFKRVRTLFKKYLDNIAKDMAVFVPYRLCILVKCAAAVLL